jgi:hypothetical protein
MKLKSYTKTFLKKIENENETLSAS